MDKNLPAVDRLVSGRTHVCVYSYIYMELVARVGAEFHDVLAQMSGMKNEF